VPGGLKYQPIRDVPLKDEFDEWLARVVCFAFSIPPTAFSKQTNRATAESAQDSATAEGLQPLLVWLKSLIDRIITQVLGASDLEFAWSDRTAPDPATQATIAAAYVGAGIKTRNEVRAELGLDPIAGGDALTTATPAAPLPGAMAKAGFDPDQPRDDQGQWTNDGANSSATAEAKEHRPSTPSEGSYSFWDTPVPYYDGISPQSDGTMITGREQLIGTAAGVATPLLAMGGGAALLPAATATAADMTITIADAAATLPEGMTQAPFGRLAGFVQGQVASSLASVEATAEVIANLKTANVTADTIAAFQRFYTRVVASSEGTNLAAVHRAALLSNILKRL